MRENLRIELLKRFRTQCAAAHVLRMPEARLSRIINSWDEPNSEEKEKLATVVGRRQLTRLLEATDQRSRADISESIRRAL